MKKKIGELTFQIIPVMIGVYLGFIVSNWSNNKDQNSRKNMLIENISAEIKENHKNIKASVQYHQKLRDSSRYYLKLNKTEIPEFFKGLKTLTLTNSAFETGIQTGLLNELPIKKLQTLNRAYTSQGSYNEFGNILLSGLIRMDLLENKESVQKILQYLSISMADVVEKERKLLREYKSAINMLSEK